MQSSRELPALPEDFDPPIRYRCVWCGWVVTEPEPECDECDSRGEWRRVITR